MNIVTISRMFGAGGSAVAHRVADLLGWPVVDSALVARVASGLGTTPAMVEAIEERSPSLATRIAEALAFGSPEVFAATLPPTLPPSEDQVLNATRDAITDAAAHGPAVIVGRGAQVILAQRADAFHVLCVAPLEARVQRVMQREGLDRDVALARVRELDADRERFVRQHFRRSFLAPEHYHLCVNTAAVGIEGAARLVASGIGEMREKR